MPRRRHRAAALLPALGLVGSALVAAAPQSQAEAGGWQQWFSQADQSSPSNGQNGYVRPSLTLTAASLPYTLRLALTDVPNEAGGQDQWPIQYFVTTPGAARAQLVTATAQDVPPAEPPPPGSFPFVDQVYDSEATFEIGTDVECVDMATGVVQTDDTEKTRFTTASGVLRIVGCPRELQVSPSDVVKGGPTVPVDVLGRWFPARNGEFPLDLAFRVLVDGVQLGSDVQPVQSDDNRTHFLRSGDLPLTCGSHQVTVVDDRDTVLETRDLYVRCPVAVVSPESAPRDQLPRMVVLEVAELQPGGTYTVSLDGAQVAEGFAGKDGADTVRFRVPAGSPCGERVVTVAQEVVDPERLEEPEPVTPSGPPPPPDGPPETQVPKAFSQAVGPTRTVAVEVPFTVVCPGVPVLDVTPELSVDSGGLIAHRFSGVGFSDSSRLTVVAAGRSVPAPSATDALGRFSGASSLDLPCGPVTFEARDGAGRTARDVVQVRCPAVRLEPPVVDRDDLPREVTVRGGGFAATVPVDVLLDGVDVGDGTTDPAGRVVLPLPVPAETSCGAHGVTLRQRAGGPPPPSASASLTVVCPPAPSVEVTPEVVPSGYAATVEGTGFPPGAVQLRWEVPDLSAVFRPAAVAPVVAGEDGRFRTSVLVLRGDQLGPRRLFAEAASGLLTADSSSTLVVVSPFQPGRRQYDGSRIGMLGRR